MSWNSFLDQTRKSLVICCSFFSLIWKKILAHQRELFFLDQMYWAQVESCFKYTTWLSSKMNYGEKSIARIEKSWSSKNPIKATNCFVFCRMQSKPDQGHYNGFNPKLAETFRVSFSFFLHS